MIHVNEARKLLASECSHTEIEEVSLYKAMGRFCAEDMISPIDMPHFNQSAMDGYALRFEDLEEGKKLYIEGEIQAGTTLISPLDPNNCIRVFTGGQIPEGADTVIMQEKVEASDKHIIVQDEKISAGANVRPLGSQTKAGETVLQSGSRLSPSAASFLAGLGFEFIPVHKRPTVDIVVTGNELIRPPQELKAGKIFESNSYSLKNALLQIGLDDVRIRKAIDVKQDVLEKFKNGLTANVLIVTGGVSVGKYDLVTECLEELGVEKIFHGVLQKPGKPFFFGKKGNTMVFGLPGNPGSVMSCYYLYVQKAIQIMMGARLSFLPKLKLPISSDYEKKAGRAEFVKAQISGQSVSALSHQHSYKMNSFAVADCLIELDAHQSSVARGTLVDVHLI